MEINVLSEMTALALHRPVTGASAETVANWYATKARLHEHLATQAGNDSNRECALAECARQRSAQLLSTTRQIST